MPSLTNFYSYVSGTLFGRRKGKENSGDRPQRDPKTTEETKAQSDNIALDWYRDHPFWSAKSGHLPYSETGWDAPLPPTIETYRLMLQDPTIQLVRSAIMGPIRAGSWSYESRPGTPGERVEFVERVMSPKRDPLVRESLRALDYGHANFEVIWKREADGRWIIDDFKPLLVDITEILIDDYGNYAGLRQGSADLETVKAFTYSFDAEAQNWYGRPLLENIRTIWSYWRQQNQNSGRLSRKASGTLAIIKFPPGMGKDEQGREVGRLTQAIGIGKQITSGTGYIAVENYVGLELKGPMQIKDLVELSKGSMWHIDKIDFGNQGDNIDGLIRDRDYLDTLKVRGYLMPERALLEGKHGTKAEAETHTDTGVINCELIDRDLAITINDEIDDLLEFNYGFEARGSVYIKPRPLRDSQAQIDKMLLESIWADPALLNEFIQTRDMQPVYDRRGVPKRAPGSKPPSAPEPPESEQPESGEDGDDDGGDDADSSSASSSSGDDANRDNGGTPES